MTRPRVSRTGGTAAAGNSRSSAPAMLAGLARSDELRGGQAEQLGIVAAAEPLQSSDPKRTDDFSREGRTR